MIVSRNVSILASWGMIGFLVGVFLHSLYPYDAVHMVVVYIVGGMACMGLSMSGPHRKLALGAIFLMMLCVGIGRFELDRASHWLPKGLRPLNADGFAYVVSKPLTHASFWDPRVWLTDGRRELTRRTHILLPTDQAALLSGILYGERGFTRAQKEIFQKAGLMHIVAVSGSNVTILVCIIIPMLLKLGCSRRQAFIGLSITLILFVIFVSPSASVVRAALMGWLIQLAPMVGRLVRPSRLLLISACLFVLWKPWALLFDVSFALSFLAMGGLMTWGAYIAEVLENRISSKEMKEIISSTLGATIMTIPYSAWAFGKFTVWGLITNVFVLPLIPWTMLFGSLALFFYRFPFVGILVGGCLEWISFVAKSVEHLPFASISLTPSFWEMITVYIIISCIFILLQRRKEAIHKQNRKKRES